ncbi:unnamed protein product [Schistosoma turkestanicum]|nr:unnamed protein product [Schistosoma turkestanicum]
MARRGSSPSKAPSRPRATLPARAPPSSVAHPPAQSQQPSILREVATTAGGVAIGSVVGHAITGALSGGASSNPAQPASTSPLSDQHQSPCQYQLDELIRCTQSQSDISACSAFSEALKECSRQYGLYR